MARTEAGLVDGQDPLVAYEAALEAGHTDQLAHLESGVGEIASGTDMGRAAVARALLVRAAVRRNELEKARHFCSQIFENLPKVTEARRTCLAAHFKDVCLTLLLRGQAEEVKGAGVRGLCQDAASDRGSSGAETESALSLSPSTPGGIEPSDIWREFLDRWQRGSETEEAFLPVIPLLAASLCGWLECHGQFAEAERVLQDALALVDSCAAADPSVRMEILTHLGMFHYRRGCMVAAERELRKVVDFARAHPELYHPAQSDAFLYLTRIYRQWDKYIGVEDLYKFWVRQIRWRHGAMARELIVPLAEFAGFYLRWDDPVPAEKAAAEAYRICRSRCRPGEFLWGVSLSALVRAHIERDRLEKASRVSGEALRIFRKAFGNGHVETASLLIEIGGAFSRGGLHEEAKVFLDEAIDIARSSDERKQLLGTALAARASASLGCGEYDEAERYYRAALLQAHETVGPQCGAVAVFLTNIGTLQAERGDYRAALSSLQRAAEILRRVAGWESSLFTDVMFRIGDVYENMGHFRKAEKCYREGIEFLRTNTEAESPSVAHWLAVLGRDYLRRERFAEAEAVLREALRMCERFLGAAEPASVYVAESLAEALYAQGKDPIDSGELAEEFEGTAFSGTRGERLAGDLLYLLQLLGSEDSQEIDDDRATDEGAELKQGPEDVDRAAAAASWWAERRRQRRREKKKRKRAKKRK
ncbi:MAG: hypothetical protein KatS3mg027_0007 [Bacteroidia bacterium]|nr:MAG: hypothetical protein KatS3mg027_0007 [Bacteroidia bacterium]